MAQTARMVLSESLRRVEAEIAAGHPDLALVRCQELQTLYPRALAVHRVLGEIYLSLRKPREALGALDRALGGDPEDARACCARAIVHQMHGDSLAALAWYRRACDIRPDDAVLRSTYAELAAPLGQPSYRPTPVGLARLYLRSGLYTHAIREWEMLSAEYPDLLEAQVGLAETLWRAQRLDAAAERSRRILANAPSCVKAMLLLAAMAHDGNNTPEAQRLIQRVAEYDPDQRIAQALFADRLAAGDLALRTLVLGDDRPPVSYPLRTGQLNDSAGRRNLSRPLVRPLTGQLGEGAPPNRSATGSLTPQSRPQPLTAMPGRVSALPPEFHSIFSEAENMIWQPEDEERGAPPPAASPPTASPPTASPSGDHAPQSQPLVPPAIAEQGANMDETEVRQAVNWVHWLQAQGAHVHAGAQMPRPPRVEAPNAPRTPAGATGPLPPPTPEALRSMFAELAPEGIASGRGVVEADVISAANERVSSPDSPAIEDEPTVLWSNGGAPSAGWAPEPGQVDDWASAETTSATPGPASRPDATLEAMQRQYAASGFEDFEPHPGALAELSGERAPTNRPQPAAPPAEPLPAPDDYAGRLERARRLRAEGRTDEALTEYRAVLKNAPQLLDTILDELRETIAATPEHPEVHRLLGDARIRQGDYLGALESYNRAVALTPASDY
jgi:tetratricopeptide (TPR) repeat protein